MDARGVGVDLVDGPLPKLRRNPAVSHQVAAGRKRVVAAMSINPANDIIPVAQPESGIRADAIAARYFQNGLVFRERVQGAEQQPDFANAFIANGRVFKKQKLGGSQFGGAFPHPGSRGIVGEINLPHAHCQQAGNGFPGVHQPRDRWDV